MVTIRVGESKKEFVVHKGLIRHHSAYFDAQFSGRWGDSDTIDFDNANETTFRAFFNYIYTYRLFQEPDKIVRSAKRSLSSEDADGACRLADAENTSTEEEMVFRSRALCEMFVLGDFLLCNGFKFAAVDALVDHVVSTWRFYRVVVNYVYRKTRGDSALRQLLVDFAAKACDTEASKNWRSLNQEFLFDLMISLHGIVRNDNSKEPATQRAWETIDKCKYHEHGEDGTATEDPE